MHPSPRSCRRDWRYPVGRHLWVCGGTAFRVWLCEDRDTRAVAMTIEIHKPELEALIRERMKRGAFQNVEDVLIQALKTSPLPAEQDAAVSDETTAPTGADLVAAMQASPYK